MLKGKAKLKMSPVNSPANTGTTEGQCAHRRVHQEQHEALGVHPVHATRAIGTRLVLSEVNNSTARRRLTPPLCVSWTRIPN